jgi:predicted amidohydrolase
MRGILAFATISLGLLLATASLQAHHSFSATYDGNKPITLRGTIVKMGWQNPHAHLYVDVKNADGKVVTWEVESAGPTTLMKQGLRKEDFVGAEVVIKGFLAKDGTPTVNASSFTLVESKKEFVNDEKTP